MVNKIDFAQTNKSTSTKNSAKKSNDSAFQDTYEQAVQNKKDSAPQAEKPEENADSQSEEALKANGFPEFVMAMPFFFQMNVQDFGQLETQVAQTLETMNQGIHLATDASVPSALSQKEVLPQAKGMTADVVILTQAEGTAAEAESLNLQVKSNAAQQTDSTADSLLSEDTAGKSKQNTGEELLFSKSTEQATPEQLQQAALETQKASAEPKSDAVQMQKTHTAEHTAPNASPDEGVTLPKLPEKILAQIVNGRHEFEVNLEPKDLGKLTIKATFENGKAIVSILCSSAKTLEMLSSHAREVGAILESNLGSPTNIVLDKNPPQQSEPNYTDDQSNRGGQQEQPNQQNKQEQHQHAPKDSFLQQLRLGLI